MIDPPSGIISIACFITKYAPRTLMANRVSKNASSIIEIGLNLEMPAFTNSTPMRPCAAFTSSTSLFCRGGIAGIRRDHCDPRHLLLRNLKKSWDRSR